MRIFPAIDIKDGRCVRLTQGRFDEVTVYSKDPLKQAFYWESEGANCLHVVDLDGAKKGLVVNFELIAEIKRRTNLYVQCGGGIRDFETAKKLIDAGIDCIVIGSAFFTRTDEVNRMLEEFSAEKIALSLDFEGETPKISGWLEKTPLDLESSLKLAKEMGIRRLIFTDISRDGMLSGPNLDIAKKIRDKFEGFLIASGGIRCEEDVLMVKKLGIDGVIIGKALYNGNVNLKELLRKVNLKG
ncbi:1-(5-phosphoribosyl)-5-[(5-phosphoribosylamino)methylideneamino]imidazole-4-carboxamide isomerase [Thermovenabulum sp.]|uniref:1-(5-phosphoribosyl)-5-[(5- phosphoribosylamino)methylideneamino]imidazole-4- carboxamide isomerase n=1 Tax=Thermovenabulum sp. TaxID=3100335 RepID=UPI003C7C8B24